MDRLKYVFKRNIRPFTLRTIFSALITAVLQSEIETMQELKRRSDRSGGLDASADFIGGPMQ